jgi:cytochrome c553
LQEISHRLLKLGSRRAGGALSPSAELYEGLKVVGRSLLAALIVGMIAVLPARAQTIKERLSTCLGCHGENGQSQNPDIPSLGAQQAFYVTEQLVMFRAGLRTYAPMNDATKGLSDDDVRSIADLIAKLPAPLLRRVRWIKTASRVPAHWFNRTIAISATRLISPGSKMFLALAISAKTI